MAAKSVAPIIEASTRLFAENGYFGVSMKEIAGAAGVTEMTVFRLFRNKPNLFRTTLQMTLSRTLDPETFRALINSRQAEQNFAGAVLQAVRRWYTALSAESARLIVHAGLLKDREWRELAYSRINETISILAEAVSHSMKKKSHRNFDATTAARSLLFSLLHTKVAQRGLTKKASDDQLVDTMVRHWIHGILER